jgi:putative IMPACT (imprinted ancient) family translation regulator
MTTPRSCRRGASSSSLLLLLVARHARPTTGWSLLLGGGGGGGRRRRCSFSSSEGQRPSLRRRRPLAAASASASSSSDQLVTTVDGEFAAEEAVKKSRFVAYACGSCLQFSEAKAFLDRVSDAKARHNCWAWRGQRSQRSSDDGEPSGTAGRPILNAIEGEGLEDVMVVVTRYKSKDAPKLGAGGLLRAYGSAASTVLRAAPRVTVVPSVELQLAFPMGELGSVQGVLARYEGRKPGTGALVRGEEEWGSGVTMVVAVESAFKEAFESELTEASNGAATVTEGTGEDDDGVGADEPNG